MSLEKLQLAEIEWTEKHQPRSPVYDDIYYSSTNILDEFDHVFFKTCNLPEAWQGRKHFTIAETGFGTGMNFTACLKRWKEDPKRCQSLSYLSFEKHPLKRDHLIKIYQSHQDLKPYFESWFKVLPEALSGIHYLKLEQDLEFILVYGDLNESIEWIDTPVDAWFLDGFAPAKNKSMWSETLFQNMARLSRTNTRLSTFTSAGFVRRALEGHGFEMQKQAGYKTKRACIRGVYGLEAKNSKEPWFSGYQTRSSEQNIGIIGGGISACTTAWALASLGHRVEIFEKNHLASGASGYQHSVYKPHFALSSNPYSSFLQHNYLQLLDYLQQHSEKAFFNPCGVYEIIEDEQRLKRFQDNLISKDIHPNIAQVLSKESAQDIIDKRISHAGLWLQQSGWINTPQWCRMLIEHPNICIHENTMVQSFEQQEQTWQLEAQNNATHSFDSLIVCNAHEALQWFPQLSPYIDMVRGQTLELEPQEFNQPWESIISDQLSLIPDQDLCTLAASFERGDQNLNLNMETHKKLIEQIHPCIRDSIKNLDLALRGRAAVRCTSQDHFPLVGPLADNTWIQQVYSDLKQGFPADHYPNMKYTPGLYLNIAHGSKGVTNALSCARWLAQLISGRPSNMPAHLTHHMAPHRFFLRDLKAGKNPFHSSKP